MSKNYRNERPVPEDIDATPVPFKISKDDPQVQQNAERQLQMQQDYEKEFANILETPPPATNTKPTVRRTPGAEFTEQQARSKLFGEEQNQFQLFRAMDNLSLATEVPRHANNSTNQHYPRFDQFRGATPTEYSLWGSPTPNASYDPSTSFLPSTNNVTANVSDWTPPTNQGQPFGGSMNFWSTFSPPVNQPPPSSYYPRPTKESIIPQVNRAPQREAFYANPQMTAPIPIPSTNLLKTRSHRRQVSTDSPKPVVSPSASHRRSASTSAATSKGELGPDSPTSVTKLKDFSATFKQKETFEEASAYAIRNLSALSEKNHWKVYLELADLAKRENRIKEARHYYRTVNTLQPTAAQGWLEFAKMEEECGNLEACKIILSNGLTNCAENESLMVKCLKHFERMNHLEEARALLHALRDVPPDRTWRTMVEGGLLEARQGNIVAARRVFRYLTENVPWYGPIFQEACRFEEKCEEDKNAMDFVDKGLEANPRYGPLWFSALRLNEKCANGDGGVVAMRETITKAVKSISDELIWKLYFEAAQIEERAGNIVESRTFYVKSVSKCPPNLLWKVWMGGARTELNCGNIDTARTLLKRAENEVPPKTKAMVLLERCRLEEYANELDRAREILNKAKKYTKHEWKVFLESVLLEMRANNLDRAIQEAQEALTIHTGTGRLWAVMIQLKQTQGIPAQMQVFRTALSEVPKSGEVWCEGARIALQQKDFVAARKYLNFAIQFTPQYGDSFIEFLRLEILEKGRNADLSGVEQACVNADPNYGALWLHCKQNPLDSTRNVVRQAVRLLVTPQTSARDEVPAVTALMVNDIYQNVHQRSDAERRKAIFL